MGCGCGTHSKDGKAIVDRVREKGKADMKLSTPHVVACSCGSEFEMVTFVTVCPNCHMVLHSKPDGFYTVEEVRDMLKH